MWFVNYRMVKSFVGDLSAGTTTRATQVTGAPTKSKYALVSSPDRHLVLLGTETTIGDPASQDPMFVRFLRSRGH